MRPFSFLNATKVLLLGCALALGFVGYSAARDLDERRHFRRHQSDNRDFDRPRFEVPQIGGDRDFIRARRDRDGDRWADRRHFRRDRDVDRPDFNGFEGPQIGGDRDFIRARRDHDGDRWADRRHFRRDHFRHDRRHWSRRDWRDQRSIVARDYGDGQFGDWSDGDDDFPSSVEGDTYFGGLSAWHDPGNGTYFSSEGYRYGYDDVGYGLDDRRRGPKIIRVTPKTASRACSWEENVCVIRR